jgi:hypothetical protein
MTYRDPTELDPDREAPAICPRCGGKLVTRWVGSYAPYRESVRALPYFACLSCKIAARIFKLPDQPLHPTRRAARRAAKKDFEASPRGKRYAALKVIVPPYWPQKTPF